MEYQLVVQRMSDAAKQTAQTPYNQIAGRSVERLAAISDGIFAVAMTLLVLDLHTPAHELIHSERDFPHALFMLFPQFIAYLMSFLTLAIFWNGQQAQLNVFAQANRHLTWIHMAFLFAVSVMPFSTKLLAEFIDFRTALLCYWSNIFLLGFVLYWSWRYASRAGLLRENTPAALSRAIVRRILGAQALYAIGAALCMVNTYLSIAVIVLVQLNFAVAPPNTLALEDLRKLLPGRGSPYLATYWQNALSLSLSLTLTLTLTLPLN